MTGKKAKNEDSDILLKAIDALVPDIVKKIILTSIGGVMMTEETVRKILSELNLSKEIVALAVTQTTKAKEEVVKAVSGELRQLIRKVDIRNEIYKMLKDTKINVKMEIDFESKSEDDVLLSIKPKIRKKPTSGKTAGKKDK